MYSVSEGLVTLLLCKMLSLQSTCMALEVQLLGISAVQSIIDLLTEHIWWLRHILSQTSSHNSLLAFLRTHIVHIASYDYQQQMHCRKKDDKVFHQNHQSALYQDYCFRLSLMILSPNLRGQAWISSILSRRAPAWFPHPWGRDQLALLLSQKERPCTFHLSENKKQNITIKIQQIWTQKMQKWPSN